MLKRIIQVLLPVLCLVAPAIAQEAIFPARPITVVVGSSSGSSMEFEMRILSEKFKELTGHPILIDIRPGANGATGATYVMRAKPGDAVKLFDDATGAPGTGSRVTGIVTTLMLDLDVHMVERAQLDDLLQEQVIQLTHADDANALKVGKLIGAQAVIIGEVQQWERSEQERTNSVSLALRMIDVETGLLLFSGQGHLTDPTTDNPESSARLIVHRILTLFGAQAGLLGSGRIGVQWELQEERGGRFYVVKELRGGLPAEKAGLKVGDRVVACNGEPLSGIKTEREAKGLCRVEAGATLQLDVRRADQVLDVRVTAEKRPGL